MIYIVFLNSFINNIIIFIFVLLQKFIQPNKIIVNDFLQLFVILLGSFLVYVNHVLSKQEYFIEEWLVVCNL